MRHVPILSIIAQSVKELLIFSRKSFKKKPNGIPAPALWIPAFAGMTEGGYDRERLILSTYVIPLTLLRSDELRRAEA
jgi:hypothetical protein